MPDIMLVDAKYSGKIELGSEIIEYLKAKKIKSVALFAAVQFIDFDNVTAELKSNKIKVNLTKARRTNKPGQILGCDVFHNSFDEDIIEKSDAVIYLGDGLFHPKALLLAQINNKEIKIVIIWNPISKKMSVINKEDIIKQINTIKRNLKMYINAKKIGILVTLKPGQQFILQALKLKSHLEKQSKKAFIFIDDAINLSQLENYPFIDAWVNTACPRIATDDTVNLKQPVINLSDAFDPAKALEKIKN